MNFGETWKYEITFTQHSGDYDFFNAEKLVDEFLLNVKNRVEDLIVIFSSNVGFLWKIINRRLLRTNSLLETLDTGQQRHIKLNRLMALFILI